VTTIKERRIDWIGHLIKMSSGRTVEFFFFLGNQTEEEKQEDQNKVMVRLY